MKRSATRTTRHLRVRAKIHGTAHIPRLSVFRSHKHVIVQLIDDERGQTIAAVDDIHRKGQKKEGTSAALRVRAQNIGEKIARIALEKKIKSIVFDRGGYRYHGIVRAVAEGARKGGLTF